MSPKSSQSANQQVAKLISQAASQREATSAAPCGMFRPECDLTFSLNLIADFFCLLNRIMNYDEYDEFTCDI